MTYKRVQRNGQTFYGKHLLIDATQCNDNLLSVDFWRQFLPDLARQIDMVPYGQPIVERFGQGIEIGISGVQLIETSAIMVHTNDGTRDMYLDVFSCKDYDTDLVVSLVEEALAPSFHHIREVLRT